MENTIKVRFWGVRGSHPVPGSGTVRFGGNTACVEVRLGSRIIILDAGTGIIPLGRVLAREARPAGRELEITMVLSHLHHDHIQGFPFFLPAYIPGTRLHIYGPGATPDSLEEALDKNQNPLNFPVRLREMGAAKDIQSIRENDAITWDEDGVSVGKDKAASAGAVHVYILRSAAHPAGVYLYRIEWRGASVVYATDTEGYVGTDQKLVRFARGCDLLIHDAQYTEEHYRGELPGFPSTQGYGHSTVNMACQAASAAGTKRLVLFHHDPAYDDAMIAAQEAAARNIFPDAHAAYEGMELTVPGSAEISAASKPVIAAARLPRSM